MDDRSQEESTENWLFGWGRKEREENHLGTEVSSILIPWPLADRPPGRHAPAGGLTHTASRLRACVSSRLVQVAPWEITDAWSMDANPGVMQFSGGWSVGSFYPLSSVWACLAVSGKPQPVSASGQPLINQCWLAIRGQWSVCECNQPAHSCSVQVGQKEAAVSRPGMATRNRREGGRKNG